MHVFFFDKRPNGICMQIHPSQFIGGLMGACLSDVGKDSDGAVVKEAFRD